MPILHRLLNDVLVFTGNLQCVLSAASHLQIIELVSACSDYLRSQLEIDNCVDIITISETYSLLPLRKYAYCYLAQHLDKLTYLPEFQRMSLVQLEHVLSNDYAVECAEYDVLFAVLCWVQYDLSQRASSTMRLLSHIHFVDIPHADLRALMETPMFAMTEAACSGMRTFINGARFVSVKVNRECPSQAKGLVNCRGLEPAIVNVGGFQSSTGVTNSVTYFHKSSGCWKHLTDVPHVEQCNFGMAVLNNELYVVGGCFNLTLQENTHPFGFKYSPRTNEWKSIAPMLLERGGFYLAAVSGRLYVIGGVGDMIDPDDNMPCESYNPETDRWSAIAAMPGCREQQAGASYGNEVFISGGLEWDEVIDSLISYNVETDVWHTRSPMRTPRADHAMTAYDGKLYVAGGWIDDPDINNRLLIHDVDVYDLITNQWQTLTHVPTPRYLASLVVLDNTLYFIGGFEQSGLFDGFENNGFNRGTKKIEQFILDDAVWISEDSYPVAIWEHLSCVLHIPVYREDAELGQLLAANNNNDKKQTRSAIIF